VKQDQLLQVAEPPPLPEFSDNKALADGWDFSPATEIQGAASEVVPPTVRFDYSDVAFKCGGYLRNEDRGLETALYVAVSEPFVKVGIALNPAKRLGSLSGSSPHPIRMIAAYFIPEGHAKLAEAYCHRLLMPFHHRGEWFTCEPEMARKVVYTVCDKAARSRRTTVRIVPKHKLRGDIPYQPPASLRIAENAIRERKRKESGQDMTPTSYSRRS